MGKKKKSKIKSTWKEKSAQVNPEGFRDSACSTVASNYADNLHKNQ